MHPRRFALFALLATVACSSSSGSGKGGDGVGDGDAGDTSADAGSGKGGAVAGGGANAAAGGPNRAGAGSGEGGSPVTGSGGRSGSSGGGSGRGGGGATGSSGGSAGGGACKTLGTSCNANAPDCCEALVCVSSTSSDYEGCREPCNTAADCASGCCIPFANIPDKGFCGEASLCQCSGLDETCGGTHQCCAGFTCTTFDDTNVLGCRPVCKVNADCDTDCCVAIPTTPDAACFQPSWCGK